MANLLDASQGVDKHASPLSCLTPVLQFSPPPLQLSRKLFLLHAPGSASLRFFSWSGSELKPTWQLYDAKFQSNNGFGDSRSGSVYKKGFWLLFIIYDISWHPAGWNAGSSLDKKQACLLSQQEPGFPTATWVIQFNVIYIYQILVTGKGEETTMRRTQSLTTWNIFHQKKTKRNNSDKRLWWQVQS